MNKNPQFPFYLVRHGETVANAEMWRSGKIDTALTETGRDQAKRVAEHILNSSLSLTSIISSHLSRAAETADIINQSFCLPRHIVPDLAEQDYGAWGGRSYADTPDHHKSDPPEGETREFFRLRILSGIEQALKLDPDGTPLIVCHGGVIRSFSGHHGHDFGKISNCACYRVDRAERLGMTCLSFA